MRRIFFALFIAFGFLSAKAQTPLMPTGNLDQWYPFCSATDLLDRTFNGFDLTSSGVTAAVDRFGQPNKAYQFNGVNSEMHYSTFFSIPIFGIGEFTYSVHIYPTVAQDAIILYNGNPALNGLGIVMNNGTLGGGPGNQVALLFSGTTQVLSTPVTLNQWHHLVVLRNGNSYVFFVDGVSVGFYVPPVPPGYVTPTTVFQLGLDFTNGTRPFSGRIDDVSIYSRQLSSVEVLRLKDFNPNIIFNLGPDTAILADTLLLGGGRIDTLTYPCSKTFPGDPAAFKYQWSTGPSDTSTTSLLGFPPGIPTPDATRSLTITRYLSCPSTDAIVVRHVVPRLALGNDTVFCTGDTLVLNPTPTPGATYTWSTGATTPSIQVTATGVYYVRMDSAGAKAFDTINIIVNPGITVTLQEDDTLCQGGTYNLFPAETYTSPVYQWSDGTTTTPVFTATTTGCYWVEVRDMGCIRRDTACITILYDTVTLYNPDTAICKGAFVVARASASPTISYQWTPTAGIPMSNVPTPTITPDTSAWYVLTATIFNCNVRDSFYIDVQPTPTVKMGGNRQVCQYDSIRIAPIIGPTWYTRYSYDWTPGFYLDDSEKNAVIFTPGDTTKLVLVVSTPAGCSASDSIIVNTYRGDFLSLGIDTALCPRDSIKLFPTSSEPGITRYSWNPSTYVNDSNSATPVIRPETGITYSVIGTSMYGCKDTVTYRINVFPNAVINLEDSVVLFPGESYQFNPVTNATRYRWDPPIGLTDTAASNPIATPPYSMKYILTARTEDGCIAIDSTNVRVMTNSIIDVPNAFIPGGNIGSLKVIIRGAARLRYFRIYNRYGNMVFDAKNIEEGWDGTYGDKRQPGGVYVYETEAITSTGQIIRKQGNITVIE